jgi:hypothetical protein
MTAGAFDIFAIARKVTDGWLAEDIEDNRQAVLTALSAPQDGGKGKAERRLTVGWIAANPHGGWHRLDAAARRTMPGVQRGQTIEAAFGTGTITEPHVVLKLAKAGVRATDLAISYGDQLRIGEAGKGITLIDLRRVRLAVEFLRVGGKSAPKLLRKTKQALQARRLGLEAPDVDPAAAAIAEKATEAELRYADALVNRPPQPPT